MNYDSLLTMSASGLAQLIRDGEVSSEKIVETHIDRILEVNPTLNAVVKYRFEEALEEARQADEKVKETGGRGLPPFHGVPCTIKENLAHEGMPNTCGLVHREGVTADQDATTVARLRDAGAISLGVTNVPEFAMWIETYNHVYGKCSNPYDSKRITGGSSGGEGSIIGAGGSPLGLGSDVAGSIRYPAFFNGVFGHKPSSGLVPGTGHYPQMGEDVGKYMNVGPLARRAEDLYPALQVIAGPDGQDYSCEHMEIKDPAGVNVENLKVISVEHHGSFRVDVDLRRAQRRFVDYLAQRGVQVAWKSKLESMDKLAIIWATTIMPKLESSMEELVTDGRGLDVPSELYKLFQRRSSHTTPIVILIMMEKMFNYLQQSGTSKKMESLLQDMDKNTQEMKKHLQEEMGDNGVIFYPSFSTPAPVHGRPLFFPLDVTYMMLANVMEFPVTQVPLGLNERGLPLGMQIIGNHGNDHLTMAAAMEAELAMGGWVPPWES